MKETKMFTILVLALGLMLCSAKVGKAAPMGTAWTYQGRLMDANSTANGPYDFQFKLYDSDKSPANDYKSVDYTKLTAVLIEAVNGLKPENDLLKQRVNALERTMQKHQFARVKEVGKREDQVKSRRW